MEPYLTLQEGCYLVRGAKRGAIYDLKRGAIYSLDPSLVQILSLSLEGVPFLKALRQVWGIEDSAHAVEKGVKSLPFVNLQETCHPSLSLSEALFKGEDEPGSVWLEVTNKCNMRCIHCYAKAGPSLKRELTLKEWECLVDDLFGSGFSHFCICGGEPFVFSGLMPLLKYLVDKKAESILLFTNATLLSEESARFLARHQIGVNITFYSHLPEHHEKISRMKGSWEKTLRGIKAAMGAGASYSINIPLGAYNQNDLEETLDFLESMGVDRERAGGNIVYPMGRGCDRSVLPDQSTIFSLKRQIYQLPMSCEGKLIYRTCWSGKLLIKANGDVTPCPSAREEEFLIGNLRSDSLDEILSRERLQRLWGITLDDVAECRECEFRYGCHDCRANSFTYLKNIFAKNPYCLYDPIEGVWRERDVDEGDADALLWIRSEGFRNWPDNDDLVLARQSTGALHILNETSAGIYRLLERGRSLGDIVNFLVARYQVEEETARRDAVFILKELKEVGIVRCLGA